MSSFTIPESILSLGGVMRWCFSGSPHQLEDLVAARFFTPTLVVIRFMLYSSYLPLHLPFLLQVLPEILVSDLLAFPRSSSQTFIQPHLLTHAPLLQSLASLDSCLSFYKPQTRRFRPAITHFHLSNRASSCVLWPVPSFESLTSCQIISVPC